MAVLGPDGRPVILQRRPPELTRELGAGGVSVIAGVLSDEEHAPALQGREAVKVFERMRRVDGEVAAVLNALQLPILAADAVVDRPEDEEEAARVTDDHLAFARRNLTVRNDFPTVLRHVLSSMWAGFAWFEKVYAEGDGKLWLDKLAPRLATTLWRWEADESGELTGIVQRVRKVGGVGYLDVQIPRAKLALFTFGKEANDWGGISALRPAYRHHLINDAVYKLDAIRIERFAVGVPVFKLPDEHTADQMTLAQEMGKHWRGAEQSYVVLSGGMEFEVAQMRGSEQMDVLSTVRHHNEQIAKSVLAQFINLGTTESGSRALGESMMEFFYDAVEGHAKSFAAQLNREVVWPLMDLNFAGRPRPELRFENIGSVALPVLADALAKLQPYLNPDGDTEGFLRKRLGLPPRPAPVASDPEPPPPALPGKAPSEIPAATASSQVTLPPAGTPKGTGTQVQSLVFDAEKFTVARAKKWAADHGFRSSAVDETENTVRLRQFDPEHCRRGTFGQRELDDGVQAVFCVVGGSSRASLQPTEDEVANLPPFSEATAAIIESIVDLERKTGRRADLADTGPEGFWRALTPAEKLVRFRQLDARLDDGRDAIVDALLDLREEIADDVAEAIKKAWPRGPEGFAGVRMPQRTVDRAARAVVPELEDLYDFGRQQVRGELGRQAKALGRKLSSKPGNVRTTTILRRQASLRDAGLTPSEVGELMAYRSGRLATRLADKTMTAALDIAAGRWRTEGGNEPTGKALDDIMEAVFSSVEREAKLVANLSASESMNLGRDFEAQRFREQIQVAQYSSVLDDSSCDACRAADGEEEQVDTDDYYDLTPPLNSSRFGECAGAGQCRCIWVYVMEGASEDREELWRAEEGKAHAMPIGERLSHYEPGTKAAGEIPAATKEVRADLEALLNKHADATVEHGLLTRQITEKWSDQVVVAELRERQRALIAERVKLEKQIAAAERKVQPRIADLLAGAERGEATIAWESPVRHADAKAAMEFVSRAASMPEATQVGLDVSSKTGRAYHQAGRVFIGPSTSAETIVHELGHAMEGKSPGLRKAAQEFRSYRLGKEKAVSLRDKFGERFEAAERAAKDKFDQAWGKAADAEMSGYYTGKVYASGDTEVISMGMQLLWRDPAGFAERDPEWFKFMVGALRGHL